MFIIKLGREVRDCSCAGVARKRRLSGQCCLASGEEGISEEVHPGIGAQTTFGVRSACMAVPPFEHRGFPASLPANLFQFIYNSLAAIRRSTSIIMGTFFSCALFF